jgi:CubicO group peptidase (beta-lactamase class C family)
MDRRAFLWTGATAGAAGAISVGARAAAVAPTRKGRGALFRLSGAHSRRYDATLRRIGLCAAEHMKVHQLPGMTLALVGPDGLDAQMTLGFSDLERQAPVRPEQLFHIGSISKSFTATMIHQLAAEGKLGLDDEIVQHLPGLPLPASAAITLNHLLSHSSGLPEDPPFFPPTPDGKLWLGFQPGTAWSYSNIGFAMLGRVVEAKDGRKLADSLNTRIFKPLSMSQAEGSLLSANRAKFAIGYGPSDTDADYFPGIPLVVAPFETFTAGSGCVGANSLDMARWMRWLIGAGRGEGGGLMPDAQAKLFARPQIKAPRWAFKDSSYGSGLAYVPLEGREVMQHTGGMLAFHSSIHVDPVAGCGAFASVNSGAGEYRPRDVTAYACALLRAAAEPGLDPKPAEVAWKADPKPVLQTNGAEPEYARLAGRYADRELAYNTVILIAVKGGLAMPDGTLLEKTQEGYWRIKAATGQDSPQIERFWFANDLGGRPQNLIASGRLLERIEP